MRPAAVRPAERLDARARPPPPSATTVDTALEAHQVGVERVLVLLPEAAAAVGHAARIVGEREAVLLALGRGEARVRRVRLAQLERILVVRARLDRALPHIGRPTAVNRLQACERPRFGRVVRQAAHSHLLAAIDQVEARLVVDKLDVLPCEPLRLVLGLLRLEDVTVELLLEPLVGIVDAQLLERVGRKVLKAKDVEDSNKGGHRRGSREHRVAAGHEPREEPAVRRLRERVARVVRLLERQRHDDLIVARHEPARAERRAHHLLRLIGHQQLADVQECRSAARRHCCALALLRLERHLGQRQHRGQRAPHITSLGRAQPERGQRGRGAACLLYTSDAADDM
eukprot:5175982-Prymnesium_polylepis.1